MAPYHNERANPYGHNPLLEDPWIRERLDTYAPLDNVVKSDLSDLPVMEAKKLKRSHKNIERLVAVDGSISVTESYTYGFQVGAIKVAAVTEDLVKLREVQAMKFIDPQAIGLIYSSAAYTGLLPGRGIGHRGHESDRTWQDKFRLELFLTFKHFELPGSKKNLLTVLHSVMAPKTLICASCRQEGKEPEPLVLPPKHDFVKCPTCKKGVYVTDMLFLDSELTYLDNGGVFLSAMNLIERFLMAGLFEEMSVEDRNRTAFITDGPLAFFSSNTEINNKLLYQIQRQQPQPILFGVEKTGVANAFAELPEVREHLKPGCFAMITEGFANLMVGKTTSRKNSYAYGKRFLYRNLRGDKVFVVMVPPRVGLPYVKFEARCDEWNTYPTLGSISDVLEAQQTERFGLDTAALDIVSHANFSASLPKVLSEALLTDLVRANVSR